ncbi:hypothetical protein [Leptospira levettii]|uniref:hypothetical protein n=1 Tax=Leptospira levettii TaxID=2023178 RepID=UPI000C2A9E7B|nr:hypothetical protein [Leptospira levettii]PJZ87013.1 hypothetical protein CH368_19000 [Leptospira levettii]
MNDFWSKMPLDAPLLIRDEKRLFILGLIYFRIGSKESWQGRINHIVELANANTPLSMPRWTYAKVDYALRRLRKEGWIYASRPARNKALVYSRTRPTDVLPFPEIKEPKVEMVKVQPIETSDPPVSFDEWMKELEVNECS